MASSASAAGKLTPSRRAARIQAGLRDVLGMMRLARKQTGKSAFAQIAEMVSLRRLRVGPREYYRFRLFDDTRYTPEQKREYTGWLFEDAVYRAVNDPGLFAFSGIGGSWGGMIDKVLFDSLMRAAQVPTPKIVAIYDQAGPQYYDVPPLRTVPELERFLRSYGGDGLFIKPARAHSGRGALAIERVDGDDVYLTDGSVASPHELAVRIAAHSRVVLQERLTPHPLIASVSGTTLATLRVVVLRGDEASEIHRIVLRLPVAGNIVDNFDESRNGNLVASVDPETGEVIAVYVGWGFEQRRLERHPDSGASFEGLMLPDWQQARSVIESASRILVGMPFQTWDLALSSRGPVMIEVNDISGQNILQLAGPPGLLDRRLCDFLRERGFRWPYPHA